VEPFVKALRAEKALTDFDFRFVSWSPPKDGVKQSDSLQNGEFREHMKIISSTDVHISGPGTGQMYQTFLPDGAIHINLGMGKNSDADGKRPAYMEEHMAEGAPHIRALHYRRPLDSRVNFDMPTLVQLLGKARQLLSGNSGPALVSDNLSPNAMVFKAYCYLAHEAQWGRERLAHELIPLRDIHDETHLGNKFAEDFVYVGLPWYKSPTGNPNKCLIGALRASYDARFPDAGPDGHGWFGTSGVFSAEDG